MPIAAVTPYFGAQVVAGTAASAGVAVATAVGADNPTAVGVAVSGALATNAKLESVSCMEGTTTGSFTVEIGHNDGADNWDLWESPSMYFIATGPGYIFQIPPGSCPMIAAGETLVARSRSTAGTQTVNVRVTYSAVA
jgi:hypothetical protein